jgi:hypothetical protein
LRELAALEARVLSGLEGIVGRDRPGRRAYVQSVGRRGFHGRPSSPNRRESGRPRARRSRASATRSSARSGDSGSDDGEPEPPRLRLWRHERFGACSPSLLRLLLLLLLLRVGVVG